MNIQPLGDRVLVKIEKEESTTSSGIVVSTENKEKAIIVQALGEDCELPIKEGDAILVSNREDLEDEYAIVESHDVIAVVNAD